MGNWVIAALLILGYFFFCGHRKLKEIKRVETMVKAENKNMEVFGSVTYHGGFPPMPKPSHLSVGLSDEYLVLYDRKGNYGRVYFDRFKNIEKFTTRTEADLKGKSVVFWGPLAPLVFRAKIRHFVVINYIDINDEENNILLETKELPEQKELYNRLKSAKRKYKWSRHGLTQGSGESIVNLTEQMI
ncbi:MAG: hypothetical protein HPY81_08960 [Firmicutes bacterium]|nr:hypothetical protein [Bacillota bacterium]